MQASVTVEDLLTLQDIDVEIHKIQTELDRLSADVEELQTTVEDFETRATSLRAQRDEAEERLRKFQRSVQAGRATLKRLEAREQQVTNMQQHFAVRNETETARRNLRAAEEDALDAMQDVEQATSELEALEAELAMARGAFETRSEEVRGLSADLEERLATHRDQKRGQEERLDRRALQLYESVSRGRNSALAELTPDGVCGNCFTAVPLQRQADIRAGRDLAVCEGCGVILHNLEETE